MTRYRPRHATRRTLVSRATARASIAGPVLVPLAVVALIGTAAAVGQNPSLETERVGIDRSLSLGGVDEAVAAVDGRERWRGISRGSLASRRELAPARRLVEGKGSNAVIRPTAQGARYLTTALNFWSGPGEKYQRYDVLATGVRVSITGVRAAGYAQVLVNDRVGWVNADYLAAEKPTDEGATEEGSSDESSADVVGGISSQPCAAGSAVEAGLTPDAIRVHRAVCAQFPQVTAYGGLRSDGEHGQGRALDIMISGATGDAIAEYARANASVLGVSEVLWAQRIWTVQRSSEGWRYFADRGSVTANHFDHVHVTVYGYSGG